MKWIAALFAAVTVAGCASVPTSWMRVDGKPVDQGQLTLDQTVCKGEMQKANLASNTEPGLIVTSRGVENVRTQPLMDVYAGCMAASGYIAAGK
jgi:hypothetical protein